MCIHWSLCVYIDLYVYTSISMCIHRSLCIYNNPYMYTSISMCIHRSLCIYNNPYMYTSISMHIQQMFNMCIQWSLCVCNYLYMYAIISICIQRSLCIHNNLYMYTMISIHIQRSLWRYIDLYNLSGLSLTTKKRFMTSSSPDHVPMRPWLRPRRRTDGGNLYRRGMESSAVAEVNVPCLLTPCWFKKRRNCRMCPFPEPDRPHFYFFPDAKRRFIQRLVLPG
jgi:hypothetical protein